MRALALPAAALLLAALGCSSTAVGDYPMAPPCNDGDGGSCLPPVITGTGGATVTTTSSTTVAAVTLTGTVALVSSPSFSLATATPYQGSASVVGTGPQGVVTAPYGGAAGTTFTLQGLSQGTDWLLVTPTNGGTEVLSTWSAVTAPSASSVTLPLLSSQTLTNIAAGIPALSGGLSPTAAQLVVQVTKSGSPYANLTATGGTGSAVVVYDTGPGTYSASAAATGAGGTILLFNAQLSGQSTVTLKDNASSATLQVPVHAAAGAATYATSAN